MWGTSAERKLRGFRCMAIVKVRVEWLMGSGGEGRGWAGGARGRWEVMVLQILDIIVWLNLAMVPQVTIVS